LGLSYVLQSSIAGKVSFTNLTANQTKRGDNAFSIICFRKNDCVGKVKAAAQNSGKIKIGQELRYVLANFPDREFGTLTGRVKNISLLPDAEGKLVDILLPENLKPITIKQPFSARK
jgi:hypothetical protein